MGIATSAGVIRDFAGSYYVSEDEMAFGWPTRYIQLDLRKVSTNDGESAVAVWDRAVAEASEEYKHRVHNLCADNCHSHVALALERMRYNGIPHWNMVKLAGWILVSGRYVDAASVAKTWLPFLALVAIVVVVCVLATTL